MFSFRPKSHLPGFRVGQSDDVAGFAFDPNGLTPTDDPSAPIGDGSPPAQATQPAPPALGLDRKMRLHHDPEKHKLSREEIRAIDFVNEYYPSNRCDAPLKLCLRRVPPGRRE